MSFPYSNWNQKPLFSQKEKDSSELEAGKGGLRGSALWCDSVRLEAASRTNHRLWPKNSKKETCSRLDFCEFGGQTSASSQRKIDQRGQKFPSSLKCG